MSEERNEVHIKTYDEWLKYYKNATKEQVIEHLTRDVQYFADAVKDIKDLQQKVEQLEKENEQLRTELKTKDNIINELEEYTTENIEVLENRLNSPFCNFEKATKELLIFQNYLDKLKELKEQK